MKKQELKIEGMSCQHCVKAVEVEFDELNLDSYEVEVGSAIVQYDEEKVNYEDILNAVDEAGFKVV